MRLLSKSFILLLLTSACASHRMVDRHPSSEVSADGPAIHHFVWGKKKKNRTPADDVFTPDRWNSLQAGGRANFLNQFYSASINTKSNRGLFHQACFQGSASDVKKAFFSKMPNVVSNPSVDGKMLGIVFDGNKRFRLASCMSGKAPIGENIQLESVKVPAFVSGPDDDAPPIKGPPGQGLPDSMENGFDPVDKPVGPTKLPIFKLAADYHNMQVKSHDRPWQGMDISTPQGAFKFAVLLQQYAYEGMFQGGDNNPNYNLIAQNNHVRDWCHVPWMNVGPSGREWVHGLTRERDLKPSPTMTAYKNPPAGTDWGVGYFNSYGCRTLAKVFANRENPNFEGVNFEDGAVIVKFLFTTADWELTKNAFKWDANATDVGSNTRSLRKVNHIQMDIAVRDSTLRGVQKSLNDWVMLTYYFDPTYDYDAQYKYMTGGDDTPLKTIVRLPKGFKMMRPQGIQTNFDSPGFPQGADQKYASYTGASLIFFGAQTNEPTGRLNGPADNPKSSCLGCHGTAGTKISMVPGFNSFEMWNKNKPTVHLDFNQQLALAKENYETSGKK